jgi:hypothetical protein
LNIFKLILNIFKLSIDIFNFLYIINTE